MLEKLREMLFGKKSKKDNWEYVKIPTVKKKKKKDNQTREEHDKNRKLKRRREVARMGQQSRLRNARML